MISISRGVRSERPSCLVGFVGCDRPVIIYDLSAGEREIVVVAMVDC